MRHVYDCPLRWSDLDMLGHVNNVVYVDYLQEARVDMLRTQGRMLRTDGLVEGVVVVRHEVTYLAPLGFGFEPVRIECWVTEIKAASFTMAYEIFAHSPGSPDQPTEGERVVYLRASTVLAPYVFADERPRRLTAQERTDLAGFLEPAPGAAPRVPAVWTGRGAVYPLRVRFSDVDVYGHVNNVKYFEFLQEARVRMTSELWGAVPADAGRPSIVVAQTDVDYRAPILLRPETYDVLTWVHHVGTRSFVLASEIHDGDRVLARALTTMVFFDLATQRSSVPPEDYRDRLVAALAG